MIKGLMGSNGVVVMGGNTSLQYINQNSNIPLQGMIRIWGTDLQVFDGHSWNNIVSSYATVELDQETKDLLAWAKQKQEEEIAMWAAPNDHPAVLAAKDHFNKARAEMMKAEQQLKATVILSKDYDKSTS